MVSSDEVDVAQHGQQGGCYNAERVPLGSGFREVLFHRRQVSQARAIERRSGKPQRR
jgi:hypothetical protein